MRMNYDNSWKFLFYLIILIVIIHIPDVPYNFCQEMTELIESLLLAGTIALIESTKSFEWMIWSGLLFF